MSWLTKIFTNRASGVEEEDAAFSSGSHTRNRHFGAEPHYPDDAEITPQADAPEGLEAVQYDAGHDAYSEDRAAAGVAPVAATASAVADEPAHEGFVTDASSRAEKPASLPRFTMPGQSRTSTQLFDADRMRPLRKAFTPSHPITDTGLFAGRRDLLMRLIHLIEDQGLHVVLYGDRGIGKTSLLRVLADLAEQGNYKVTYASCGSDTDFDSLFRSLAREVPLLYHSDYEPISPEVEAGKTFADLLPDRPATVVDVTTLFEAVRGTQLLIFIDEFDRCESDRMREQVAELIKNLSDRGVAVQCVIAGVASNLTALVSHIPSIRRNLIGLPVGPLNDLETREMLQVASQRSGVPFSKEAIEKLLHYTNGLPYLNQLLGLHSTIAAVKAGHSMVTEQDVAAALVQALEEIRLRLTSRGLRSADKVGDLVGWSRLGELARRALVQVGIVYDTDIDGLPSTEMNEILVFTSDEEGDRWSFREEAIVPYVWMKSQVLAA